MCGECVTGTVCHPVHGTCPGGCKSGYTGNMCKEGESNIYALTQPFTNSMQRLVCAIWQGTLSRRSMNIYIKVDFSFQIFKFKKIYF